MFARQHEDWSHVEKPMHQLMQSHAAPATCPCTADLLDYQALIHVGCLVSPDRFQLALQALEKTSRFWPGNIALIITADKEPPTARDMRQCSFRAVVELQPALDHYHKTGLLLFSGLNGCFGDVMLHALASGVPLNAFNFSKLGNYGRGLRLQPGDSFLAVGHAPVG